MSARSTLHVVLLVAITLVTVEAIAAPLDLGELSGAWGHAGYDLAHVQGLWRPDGTLPWTRGLHVALDSDDRFLMIANLGLAIRFIEVNEQLQERGHSFEIEQLIVGVRGNLLTPRLAYMVNFLAGTAVGSPPLLLDAMLAWSILPKKLVWYGGQLPTDTVPQATVGLVDYQLGGSSLATRFFSFDRSIGTMARLSPLSGDDRIAVQAGAWNSTIRQGPAALGQFNPDLGFLVTVGVDYLHGADVGAREGDFVATPALRLRASLRMLYADFDTPRPPGELALRGRLALGHLQLSGKCRGASLLVGGLARWSSFIENAPDIVDLGLYVQAGLFVWKQVLEISLRYSEVWPDASFHGTPRDLPSRPLVGAASADVLAPVISPSKIEAGGGVRLFPFRDPMFSLLVAYLWRDVDSAFVVQANAWF